MKDRTLDVPAEVSIDERFAVRAATGCTVTDLFTRFDVESLCVLWWLARRRNGEPNLAWVAHKDEWPANLDVEDIDLTVVEDDGGETDNPES